jgi:phospholipase/carboxylesterase
MNILKENYQNNDFQSKNIYSHGTVDQVIPVAWAKTQTFRSNWNQFRYKEYPIGHGISPQVFYDFKAGHNE